MYEIGLSTSRNLMNEEFFRMYKDSGIKMMEVSCAEEDYVGLNYEEIRRMANEYDIKLWSFHLPYSPFSEIDISKKELCRSTITYFSEMLKRAANIGIDKFVIHPSGEPIMDDEREERIKCAQDSLVKLADIALKEGAVIAVENLPRTCLGKNSDEMNQLISVHDKLSVCFDTNHLLREDPVDFVYKVGSKIITTHISDCDFVNERYWLPGEGKVKWPELIRALKEVGYNGVWLYEIGFANPKGLIRQRNLTCDDFVQNAMELFENRSLTILAKR